MFGLSPVSSQPLDRVPSSEPGNLEAALAELADRMGHLPRGPTRPASPMPCPMPSARPGGLHQRNLRCWFPPALPRVPVERILDAAFGEDLIQRVLGDTQADGDAAARSPEAASESESLADSLAEFSASACARKSLATFMAKGQARARALFSQAIPQHAAHALAELRDTPLGCLLFEDAPSLDWVDGPLASEAQVDDPELVAGLARAMFRLLRPETQMLLQATLDDRPVWGGARADANDVATGLARQLVARVGAKPARELLAFASSELGAHYGDALAAVGARFGYSAWADEYMRLGDKLL